MPDDHDERLTILERAQLLHDATLRRHGDMLDTHAEAMAELRRIQERQERLMETMQGMLTRLADRQDQQQTTLDVLTHIAMQHEERMARLQQTLDAIKDLLDRGNGH